MWNFLRASPLVSPDFKTYITAIAYASPTYENPRLRNDPNVLYCPAPWELRAWNDDPDHPHTDDLIAWA